MEPSSLDIKFDPIPSLHQGEEPSGSSLRRDMKDDGSSWYIVTPPESFEAVKEALNKAGLKPESAELAMVPQNYIKLTGQQAQQMMRLVEALEEHDDVQHVYANFDIDESEIQAAVGAN